MLCCLWIAPLRAKKKGRPGWRRPLRVGMGMRGQAARSSCQRLSLRTVRRAMNRRRRSAPMPSPTRFSAKTSTSPVMSGATTTRATTPATTTRLRFHHGQLLRGLGRRVAHRLVGRPDGQANERLQMGQHHAARAAPGVAPHVDALAVRPLPETPARPTNRRGRWPSSSRTRSARSSPGAEAGLRSASR